MFEDGNIDEYTGPGMSMATVTAAAAFDGSYGLSMDADWIYRNDSAARVQRGDVISTWWARRGRPLAGPTSARGHGPRDPLDRHAPNTGQLLIQRNAGYGYTDIGAVGHSWLAEHWYRMEVTWGTTEVSWGVSTIATARPS